MYNISQNGIKFITEWEGCKLNEYKDVVGKPTIGVGHLIKPGEHFNSPITQQESDNLLKGDLSPVQTTLNCTLRVNLTQYQLDALFSLAFNIGVGGFSSSTVLRECNANDIQAAGDAFLMWDKAGGNVVPGLQRRREAERTLFLTGKYN